MKFNMGACKPHLIATRALLVTLVAVASLLSVVVFNQNAFAARANSMNDAELYVETGGAYNPGGRYTGPNCDAASVRNGTNVGALWVTGAGGGAEGAVVVGNATTIDVRLYSTIRGCGSTGSAAVNNALAHLSDCGGSAQVRFTLKPSAASYRWNDDAKAWQWTNYYIAGRDKTAGTGWSTQFQGDNYISATLNIGNRVSGNYQSCIRGSYSAPPCSVNYWCLAANRTIGFQITRLKDFTLTPTISVTPQYSTGDSLGTEKATLAPIVNNSGTTESNPNIQWKVVMFRLAPGAANPIPAGGLSNTSPEQFFGRGAIAIASAQNQTFQRNATPLTVNKQIIGDFPVGTRICYALSVQPRTRDDTRWAHSNPACVTIAKAPKINVLGGDIRVGSNFVGLPQTTTSNIKTSQTTKRR